MDILKQKRVTDNGDGKGYFRNCVEYPYKEKPEPDEELIETRGYNVNDTDPDMTYDQMYAVKDYYGKTGDNPVMHFILSYDKRNVSDAETACAFTEKVAGLFSDDYQVLTATHKEDQGGSLYHAHFIVNTVDIHTGRLYHSGQRELTDLAVSIYNITGNYCKPEIFR